MDGRRGCAQGAGDKVNFEARVVSVEVGECAALVHEHQVVNRPLVEVKICINYVLARYTNRLGLVDPLVRVNLQALHTFGLLPVVSLFIKRI